MKIEILLFNEIRLLPELFLAISVIYFLVYGTFLSVTKNYPLIHLASLNLAILILSLLVFLIINEKLIIENLSFNNTVIQDYLSFFSKSLVVISSLICMLFFYQYLKHQRINQFEYLVLFLLGVLGVLLLCSSNDLLTAYLAIELQSLAFYVLAAFKKSSTFSIDAGLKYFILGAFSSSLFLFGSSLIYGLSGTITFVDFCDLLFWVFPASNSVQYFLNNYNIYLNEVFLIDFLLEKLYILDPTLYLLDLLQSDSALIERFNTNPTQPTTKVFFHENLLENQKEKIFALHILQD